MHDTTQQPADELAALHAAFELVSQAVFVVDARNQRIVDANPAGCEMLGAPRGELIGRSWNGTEGRISEATLRDVDGRRFVAVVPGPPSEGAGRRDVPRDALTGLANRAALHERISPDNGGEPPNRLALLFIDLDDFKQVNDTWGHVAGDRVLRVVAQRLSDSVRPGDLVVRYGGDEFLVVVEGVSRRRDLNQLARRITRGMQLPILVEGHQIVLSASIGIAQRNSRVGTIDALIAEADRAMYRCKSHGRNTVPEASAARVLRGSHTA